VNEEGNVAFGVKSTLRQRIVTSETSRGEARADDIQSGKFARDRMLENNARRRPRAVAAR
jgi:ketol-acid reductoisomerase